MRITVVPVGWIRFLEEKKRFAVSKEQNMAVYGVYELPILDPLLALCMLVGRSEEGRANTRNIRDFHILYGGQITLSIQLVKPNDLVILPTDTAPQFL